MSDRERAILINECIKIATDTGFKFAGGERGEDLGVRGLRMAGHIVTALQAFAEKEQL